MRMSIKTGASTLTDEQRQSKQLARFVKTKYAEITQAYEAAVDALLAGYTRRQQETFWLQTKEAFAYLDDPLAPTPFIDGLVANEPETKEDIVQRIIANANNLAPHHGMVTGKYQGLVKQLAAVDPAGEFGAESAKLDMIVW